MNAVAVYDARYSAVSRSHEDIIQSLSGIAKKYCFQLEESDSGYRHYQMRMSLTKKRRRNEALKLFPENFKPEYFQPTTNKEYQSGDNFYCLKLDTRISGPWRDDDVAIYIPRQVRDMRDTLRPFQQHIAHDGENYDPRTINVLVDTKGNSGKSCLTSYVRCCVKGGCVLPSVNDYRDVLRMVCYLPTATLYIIDMPRSMPKWSLQGFYSAIESVKSGYAYDDRYKFKEKHFDSPSIWIMTNQVPDLDYLSHDRWKLWKIDGAFELKKLKKQ